MESAKLSPTQLYSGSADVFSNGSTMTTSVAGVCAMLAGTEIMRIAKTNNPLNNLLLKKLIKL
jgi:hypothetical protein